MIVVGDDDESDDNLNLSISQSDDQFWTNDEHIVVCPLRTRLTVLTDFIMTMTTRF